MKRNQAILLVGAILLTAFFGVSAKIRKDYAEVAEQQLKEVHQKLELAERTSIEIKENAQESAAMARIAENKAHQAMEALQKCKTRK